jgi:hypothetical protein
MPYNKLIYHKANEKLRDPIIIISEKTAKPAQLWRKYKKAKRVGLEAEKQRANLLFDGDGAYGDKRLLVCVELFCNIPGHKSELLRRNTANGAMPFRIQAIQVSSLVYNEIYTNKAERLFRVFGIRQSVPKAKALRRSQEMLYKVNLAKPK